LTNLPKNLLFNQNNNFKIEDLYNRYKETNDNKKLNFSMDLKTIKDCIDTHNNDLVLRNYVFDLVVKGLINSKETTIEYGLYRAKKFLEDIRIIYSDTISIDFDIIDFKSKKNNIMNNKIL